MVNLDKDRDGRTGRHGGGPAGQGPDGQDPRGGDGLRRLRWLFYATAGVAFVMLLLFVPRGGEFNPIAWKDWSRQPDDCVRYQQAGEMLGTIGLFANTRDEVISLLGEAEQVTGDGCVVYDMGRCNPARPQIDTQLRVCFDVDQRVRAANVLD